MRFCTLFACSWLFCRGLALGQVKDTTLQEVNIHTQRKVSSDLRIADFAPGQKVQAIDEATLRQYQLQNMSDMLAQQVPVFIKSYGINGLATLSFRGASAAQSQVVWNGVPIQNAALGVTDISTLPVLMVNKANIVYGGSAALLGSGNVGGALMLGNETPVFDTGKRSMSVSGGAGSFGQYSGALSGAASGKRLYFSATAFAQSAENNFPYTDLNGAKRTMTNSNLHGYAGMVRAAYKIKEQNIIGLTAWYQHYDRQIPPALFEPGSSKEQIDGSLRLLADWTKHSGRNTWYAKSALIRDEVNYTDSSVTLQTDNTAWQYYQEIGLKRNVGNNGQWLLFTPLQVLWMNVAPTNELKRQTRIALAGSYDHKLFGNRVNAAINARAEIIDNKHIFLPGASLSYSITRWLTLRANGQRTYRVPTLNELYYVPGGNPSLKPEQGWSEDAGYSLKAKYDRFTLYHDLSVFNRNINDWIIWLGGAIWTPHNIASVHSRGMETDNKLTYNTGKWAFHISLGTSYVLATTTSSYVPNDGSLHKQIPYVPRYNGRVNAGITYRQFSFNYIHTYTGYRFTTSDESEYLLPYQSGNIQLLLNAIIFHHNAAFTVQGNNIWNQQYYISAYRPMPGINWLAAFKLTIL